MKLHTYFAIAALLTGSVTRVQALENDTLFVSPDTLGTQYTLSFSSVQLNDAPESSFGILIRRPYSTSNTRGTWMEVFKDRIESNGTIVANHLQDGSGQHDYLLIRSGSTLQLYRNGILLANMLESTPPPMQTSQQKARFEYTITGLSNLSEGYEASVISETEAQEIDESLLEENISDMLTSDFRNMVSDPYLNHGFTNTGLNAGERIFYSNAATWGGWGSEAEVVYGEGYSGNSCIRISGQASNNGTSTTGASLDLPISFTNSSSYLIRAMVKSDGYVGKIAIENESGYIPITDTQNEWKQIEGVLNSTGSRKTLYINNFDFVNSGTLYIDNVEVYKTLTTIIRTTHVPYYEIGRNKTYRKSTLLTDEQHIYMLGYHVGEGAYSQLDTTGITYSGAARLTHAVEGSQLYPIYFAGDLQTITVTGYYDGFQYTDKPLFNGVDYILQKYTYPYFDYCPTNENVKAGTYLIQFVDNLDEQNVVMTTGKKEIQNPSDALYRMVGNPEFAQYTPEGKFLKFNLSDQKFVLTEGETINPFEAYIEVSPEVSAPVHVIYPQWTTSFTQIESNDGSRMSIYAVEGGVRINALQNSYIDVYAPTGQKITSWEVSEGENFRSLPMGFYIVGGEKIIVSR